MFHTTCLNRQSNLMSEESEEKCKLKNYKQSCVSKVSRSKVQIKHPNGSMFDQNYKQILLEPFVFQYHFNCIDEENVRDEAS